MAVHAEETESEEGRDVAFGGDARNRRTPRDLEARFWLTPLPKDDCPCDVHTVAVPWADRLRNAWRRVAMVDREHDLIYENRRLRRAGMPHPGIALLDMAGFDVTRLFVTTSIVDTFTARMAARRTKTAFVVDDAEWSLKRRAQDFRRWLDGKQRDTAFDATYVEIIRDACVRGDGVVYIDDSEDDVFAERVHRSELLIDPYEARQGPSAVRTVYRMRAVSRDSLIAIYPEHEEAILAAPEAIDRPHDMLNADWLASEIDIGRRDVVDFVEAWHLPTHDCEDDAEDEDIDGRKFAGLVNATLCYQPWRTPRFPFARLSRYKPMRGYWARGDCELLRSGQTLVNRMVDDIAMNVAATGKGIMVTPMDIEPAQVTGYRPMHLKMAGGGRGIEFVHPVPVGPVTLQLLETNIRQMYDLSGAAQWFSQGRSPLGNDVSGAALDTMEDQLSARHAVFEGQCSTFCVDAAQAFIDAAQRVARRLKDDPKKRRAKPAAWMDKGTMRQFNWDEVSLEGDEYRLQAEPISAIPTTRGGKLKWISEMLAKGVIPSDQAASLYDEPDVAHANRILLGAMKNAERIMEILGDETKEMPTPEEWHDLDLLVVYCKAYFNRAQAENAPPEVETRYREFGDAAIALRDKAKGAAALPPGPPMDPAAMPPPGMDPAAMAPGPPVPIPGLPLGPGVPPPMMPPGAA